MAYESKKGCEDDETVLPPARNGIKAATRNSEYQKYFRDRYRNNPEVRRKQRERTRKWYLKTKNNNDNGD